MIRKQDKSLTIRVSSEWMDVLDKWIAAQRLTPTRTQVIMTAVMEFIEGQKVALSPNQDKSAPRLSPQPEDQKALRSVRRGVASALEKRAGANVCPDCGANLNLVGARHNCTGKKK